METLTLERAYYIGELAAAIGVIISLIYVGIQIKLSTKATWVAASHAFVDTNHTFVGLINQSESLADILFRGSQGIDNLSGAEMVQFSAFYDQCFMTMESNFYLYGEMDLTPSHRYWLHQRASTNHSLQTGQNAD
jgi:hypothetical protein